MADTRTKHRTRERAAMRRSRSRTLRKMLIEGGWLILITLVPAIAGTILLDRWFPNWGKHSEDGSSYSTIGGMPRGAAKYMIQVDLKPGTRAPNLDVESLDGSEIFHLNDYRGVKPVVLVFGSMSCG